jgi:hypothetical protein
LQFQDARLFIGNGSEKFAMQVQVKNFQNEAAQFAWPQQFRWCRAGVLNY